MGSRARRDFVSFGDETAGVDELNSIERPTANITLIASGVLAGIVEPDTRMTRKMDTHVCATVRACPLHKAIC